MWSDWLVFCDYDFSVSALRCPLATPMVLLGFLLPWTWGVCSRLLQQSAATAPYLGQGHASRPQMWSSSSRPSCACTAAAPWTWGCSSWPSPLASYVGWLLSATTSDLRCGIAPLSHSCAIAAWCSWQPPWPVWWTSRTVKKEACNKFCDHLGFQKFMLFYALSKILNSWSD